MTPTCVASQPCIGAASAPCFASHDELDAIAGRLPPVLWALDARDPVAHTLGRFAIAARRLAASERAWFDPIPVDFEGLPSDEDLAPRRRLLEVDVFSMFVFGDLVLDAVGIGQLQSRVGAPARWVSFVNYLDEHPDPTFLSVARELQVCLHNGRNLLVVHPRHQAGLGFGMDERASVGLASVDMHGDSVEKYEEAGRLLRQLAAKLGLAHNPTWNYSQMRDVLTFAGAMGRSERELVETAMRLGGHLTIPMAALATLVRDLARAHETTMLAKAADPANG